MSAEYTIKDLKDTIIATPFSVQIINNIATRKNYGG